MNKNEPSKRFDHCVETAVRMESGDEPNEHGGL